MIEHGHFSLLLHFRTARKKSKGFCLCRWSKQLIRKQKKDNRVAAELAIDNNLPRKCDVTDWFARYMQHADLAVDVVEYGCLDRTEVILANLIKAGFPVEAMGRISTFYEQAKHPENTTTLTLDDPLHSQDFRAAWDQAFGNDVPKELTLKADREGRTIKLNVSGKIQWNIGHISPTIDVLNECGRLERLVLDATFDSDYPMSIDAWRAFQRGEEATLLWGQVGLAPDVVVDQLPPHKQQELAERAGMPLSGLQATLCHMPRASKDAIYAEFLDIDDTATYHPRHWAGYELGGEMKDADGMAYPDWHQARGDVFERRLGQAERNLFPLKVYSHLHAAHDAPEQLISHYIRNQENDAPSMDLRNSFFARIAERLAHTQKPSSSRYV
jgi:hypothetical protein